MEPNVPNQPTALDPGAVNLAKAIRQTESNGDFAARGKSGEYGGYQFMPATWAEWSRQAGVNVPLEQATPQQQNEVAYKKIKGWKDQGYNVGQIASMWNAGPGRPNAYIEGNAGVNSSGVSYDTKAYAQKVALAYQSLKSQSPNTAIAQGTGPAPQAPEQQQQQEENKVGLLPNVGKIGTDLGTDIAGRFTQGSEAISKAITGGSEGNVGQLASGGLQAVGALAGGVGDIANAAFKLIPGVQAVEEGLSKALGSFAKTGSGQKVVSGITSFAEKHPEIAGDIGAAINIASVIPMFKGLGLVAGGLQDAATVPFRGALEKAASNELRVAVAGKAATTLSQAESRGLNPLKVILDDPKSLPQIVEAPGGKFVYSTEVPAAHLQSTLAIDEQQLQQMLDQGVKQNIMVNLDQAKAQMTKDMLKAFPVSAKGGQGVKAINEFFSNVEPTTGGRKYVSINELNGLKRDVGGGVNWANLGTKNGAIKSAMYRSLMQQVENYASQAGVSGVRDLNRVMGEKIEALNFLGALAGKGVKQSQFGKVLREIGADLAGAGGEAIGNQTGVPFSATLAGRGLYRLVPGRVPMTATRALGRSGRGSVKSSITRGLVSTGAAQGLRSTAEPRQ